VGSHGSLSLLFVMKVTVCHFLSNSHEVMTALIVMLPIIVVVEISLQLHQAILVFLSWSLVYPRLGCKDLCQQSFFFSCSFSSTLTCHYLSRVQQYFPFSFSLLWIGSSLFSHYSDILTACGCSLDAIICVCISSDSCCCSSAEPSRPGLGGFLRTNQCTLWMAENWYAQGTL
jgi:hypothetical protein